MTKLKIVNFGGKFKVEKLQSLKLICENVVATFYIE